jgi:predicted negative regulator of RcsB-dependent stress response
LRATHVPNCGYKLILLGLISFAAWSSLTNAQSAITSPNAAVSADTLAVYSEMSRSSAITTSLKKADEVIVDFEIKTTEKWCSVRLPTHREKLGYVQCGGLARKTNLADSTPANHGGMGNADTSPPSSKRAVKDLAVAKPPVSAVNGYVAIYATVVREDAIDIGRLADLESAARGGSPAAMSRAALGHYAAGNFELSRNSLDEAVEQYQAAVAFADRDTGVLLPCLSSLAYVHLIRGEYGEALGSLERARKVAPQSVVVARLSGWAYYGLDRMTEASTEWKRAQKIQPNSEIGAALEKAERDQETEAEFRQAQTGHFSLHYQGNATPQLSAEILRTLEEDFSSLQSQLKFAPSEPIGVVLYTQETFRDITRAPGWAGALNDGRIRVPIRGLNTVNDELSRVLKHELTHSFLRQRTLGRCPTWLQEGLAQWMEGRRSNMYAAALVATYNQGTYIHLRQLEGSWNRFPGRAAEFAYAWSLATVESIIADSGMYGLERFFAHFANDATVEAALQEALQVNYADLERRTVDYLGQTYLPN